MQKELELDEKALSNLQADRQRFLCKAVENYVQCLEQGEEHDTWVFRLASLWLENGDAAAVNATMKVREGQPRPQPPPAARMSSSVSVPLQEGVRKIPSHKFLPLMYQLAARMGTKTASEDGGFRDVLHSVRVRMPVLQNKRRSRRVTRLSPPQLMCRACVEHPHHTLFIILALVNANRDKAFCTAPVSKGVPWQPSPLDLVRSVLTARTGDRLRPNGCGGGWGCPPVLQERSDRAQKVLSLVQKERSQLVSGMERLCEAYITLAYMDASRHKAEKSERPLQPGCRNTWLPPAWRAGRLTPGLVSRGHSHPSRSAHREDQRPGPGGDPHPGAEGGDHNLAPPPFVGVF